VVIVVAWWIARNNLKANSPTNDTTIPKAPSVAANSLIAPLAHSGPTISTSSKNVDELKKSPAAFQRFIDGKNFLINFSGRVVDSEQKALAQVQIKGQVRQWYVTPSNNLAYSGRFVPFVARTDANGDFDIGNTQGDSLEIESIEKQGYKLEPNMVRTFAGHDSTERVTFVLWRDAVKNPVLTGDQFFELIPDGRVYSIDAVNWKITEGASPQSDLQLWLNRTPTARFSQEYDWSFGLKVPNGGILEETTKQFESMLVAPDGNYQGSFETNIHQSAAQNWPSIDTRKQFYLKIRNENINGRIQVFAEPFINPTSDHGGARIHYAINPTGSAIVR